MFCIVQQFLINMHCLSIGNNLLYYQYISYLEVYNMHGNMEETRWSYTNDKVKPPSNLAGLKELDLT